MKIDDPKTPWEDELEEEEDNVDMTNEQDDIDPEIENHL